MGTYGIGPDVGRIFATGRLEACGWVTCPPEWEVDEAGASFSRIYRIDGGTAFYEGPEGRTPLLRGHLYVFPVFTPYRLLHDAEDPLSCLWFHIDLSPVIPRVLCGIRAPSDGPDAGLLACAEELVKCRASSIRILHVMDAYLEGLVESGVLPRFVDPRVLSALHRIQEGYPGPLPLTELAAVTGYHPRHLIRLFRKHVGSTPHRYLLLYRLKQAALHLDQGATVYEAALRSGFPDTKTFSRAFRTRYGIPPSRYAGRPSVGP